MLALALKSRHVPGSPGRAESSQRVLAPQPGDGNTPVQNEIGAADLAVADVNGVSSGSPDEHEMRVHERQNDVPGPVGEPNWHSRYTYPSTGRKKEFVGDHYLVLRQHGDSLIGQSLPHTTGSRLRLVLQLDSLVASGTWRETTSPTGYYRGATYHGTLQFVIDPSGRRMRGMWLGFGRDFAINSGSWELIQQEPSISKATQRAYHLRV